VAHWSIVGWLIEVTLLRGVDVRIAQTMHLTAWWLHAILKARVVKSERLTIYRLVSGNATQRNRQFVGQFFSLAPAQHQRLDVDTPVCL
jgi:hypothetical protein